MVTYWPKGGKVEKYIRGVRRVFRKTINILKIYICVGSRELRAF